MRSAVRSCPTSPRRRAVLVVACLLWAACDAAAPAQEPPEEPPPEHPPEAVYIPLDPGRVWAYEYVKRTRSHEHLGGTETRGRLTWTVGSTLPAADGQAVMITEAFEGTHKRFRPDGVLDGEDPTSWTRSLSARLKGRVFELAAYTDRMPRIRWAYPVNTPDTVAVDTLLFAGFGTITSKRLALVRGVGITAWYGGTAGRFDDNEALRLLDDR